MSIRIERVGIESAPRLRRQWAAALDRFQVFVARAGTGEIAGLATLSETFAIYANGNYGVIDEMYVAPAFRSQGLGRQLIDAVKAFGRDRGWARIDVTAPEGEGWDRTRRFYEREGFSFAGPKLKFPLT